MKISTDLFLMGLTLAWGPCFYSCTPIVLSYLAGTKQGWFKGLINVFMFSIARVIAYIILAAIAFLAGHMVIRDFYEAGHGRILYYAAGAVTIILGYFLLFDKNVLHFRFCPMFIKTPARGSLAGIVLLGLAVGFAPCVPMFGVINYIVFEAKGLNQAIVYAICFGSGTILGPLIPMGVAMSSVVEIIEKAGKLLKVRLKFDIIKFNLFGRLFGLILIYFGIKLTIWP